MAPFVQVVWPVSVETTGIESVTMSTDFLDSDWRIGWWFTVGASALTVTALRAYSRELHTQRVRIHRISDSVLMATADIVGVVGEYAEQAITPVVLAANTQYMVSMRRASTGADATEHARNPTAWTFASHFAFGGNAADPTVDAMPTADAGTDLVFPAPDFRYEV